MLRSLRFCKYLLFSFFCFTVAYSDPSINRIVVEFDGLVDVSAALANPGLPEKIEHPTRPPDAKIYPRDTYLSLRGNIYPAGTWSPVDFMNHGSCHPEQSPIGSFSLCQNLSIDQSENSNLPTDTVPLALYFYFKNEEGSVTNSLELEIGTGMTNDLIPQGTAEVLKANIGSAGSFQNATGQIFIEVNSAASSHMQNQTVFLSFLLELQGVAPNEPAIVQLIQRCSTNDSKKAASYSSCLQNDE